MTNQLILPITPHSRCDGFPRAGIECSALVSSWLNGRIELIREIWPQSAETPNYTLVSNPAALALEVIHILAHRTFNSESKIKIDHLIDQGRHQLIKQIGRGGPIHFFLLYNGGYRASSLPNELSTIFEPDQTELMLLYQIALLHSKISAVYDPGIEFSIVLNNGVAHWVNDTPLEATEHYANQLRRMIEHLGAEIRVHVLLQSELTEYNRSFSFEPILTQSSLSEKEHGIVERFLGHSCSAEEATRRFALYTLAESAWGEQLSSIAKAKNALMLRQVAHPEMLSFRPFPGGAIRSQNGSLGFQYHDNTLKPKLITSHSVKEHGVMWVHYDLPWMANRTSATKHG